MNAYDETVDMAMDAAEDIAMTHGQNAAAWLLPFADADAARALLAGITDGDPLVLDALPAADLSGQWADGYTVAQLLADVDLEGVNVASDVAMELADAYEVMFSSTVHDCLAKAAATFLRDA